MLPRARRPGLRSAVALLLVAAGLAALAAPAGCAGDVPCQFNSDCLVGYCQNGSCKKNCVDASRDCPPGDICNANAECVPPTSGVGGAGSTTASSGTTVTTGTGGSGVGPTSTGPGPSSSVGSSSGGPGASVAASSSSTSGGTMDKHELDLCSSDADCAAPLVCHAMTPGGSTRCTRACTSTAGCMTGTVCAPFGSAQYCVTDDTGRACNAAGTCNFACFTPGAEYCTVPCNTGADCPNGYGCMAVSNERVCVKAEAPCSQQNLSACVSDCDVSATLVVGGCTLTCSSASDCPQRAETLSPWTCDSGGICRRPPDVYGPLPTGVEAQYACDVAQAEVNVCNDGLHIDLASGNVPAPPPVSCTATMTTYGIPATDTCIDSCRYQGGCPFGNACVALGNLGSVRIGLCFPTGGEEVGAACSTDEACVFGYCFNGKCSRDCTVDGVCPGGTVCTAGSAPPVEGMTFRACQ